MSDNRTVRARRGLLRPLVIAIGGILSAMPTAAETLTYTVTPNPATGHTRVELTWQTQGRERSTLCVASRWGMIASVRGLLDDLVIEGAVRVDRDRDCWIVRHRPGARLNVRYIVSPGERRLAWDTFQLPVATRKYFAAVGNTFLVAPGPGGTQPGTYEVMLRWDLPEDWAAVCSWAPGAHVGARLTSHDLRHSIYYAGELETTTVDVSNGRELTVTLVDEFDFDVNAFAEMAADIIADQCAAMSEREFPPFVVAAVPVGEHAEAGRIQLNGSGLYQSFVLYISPGAKLTEAVEHLFAHEVFHHWNGQLLPAAEPQGDVLWFTEGFTDYYALRILYESGRWAPRVYAKWINRHLREYDANPAQNATNGEIRDGYWRERNTIGEVPYQRGLLLGLRWHFLAREHGASNGIDRLFQALLKRGRESGFEVTNAAVRRMGVELLGEWFGKEFDRYVVRADTVELPMDVLEPRLEGATRPVYEFALGFDRDRSLRDQRVRGLVAKSAAAKAGLREGDEMLGWELHGDADRKITLQVRRGNRVREISYYPRGERRFVTQFRATGR